jgi:hypothetical protein
MIDPTPTRFLPGASICGCSISAGLGELSGHLHAPVQFRLKLGILPVFERVLVITTSL